MVVYVNVHEFTIIYMQIKTQTSLSVSPMGIFVKRNIAHFSCNFIDADDLKVVLFLYFASIFLSLHDLLLFFCTLCHFETTLSNDSKQ